MEIVECGASVKLFGQVISLLPQRDPSSATSDGEARVKPKVTISRCWQVLVLDCSEILRLRRTVPWSPEVEGFSSAGKDDKRDEVEQETCNAKPSEPEEEEARKGAKMEKPPRKPDKTLPCPRCSSMDTKFCYYNNYNVKQPRHFCRDCQRYWTAGGTMRNVPVGAGRRKSKSFTDQTRHITISTVSPDGVLLPFLNDGATIGDTSKPDEGKIESRPEGAPRRIPPADHILPPPTTVLGSSSEQANKVASSYRDARVVNVYHVQPCWVYQWNDPAAGGCPIVFHPIPAYWGSTVPSPPPPPSPLGKHSRDEHSQLIPKQGNNSDEHDGAGDPRVAGGGQLERRPWVPNSFSRINDADEVAGSSVWATVATKKDRAGSVSHGGLFRRPKVEEMGTKNPEAAAAAAVAGANPVALARSLNFNECTIDCHHY